MLAADLSVRQVQPVQAAAVCQGQRAAKNRLLENAMLQRASRRRIARLAADIDLLDERLLKIVAGDAPWSPNRDNGTKNWIKGKTTNLSRGFEMDLLTRLKEGPLPFAALLGIEIVSAAPDKIVAEMTVRDELCTRLAVLHGGASDTRGALGTLANLMDGVDTTTSKARPTS